MRHRFVGSTTSTTLVSTGMPGPASTSCTIRRETSSRPALTVTVGSTGALGTTRQKSRSEYLQDYAPFGRVKLALAGPPQHLSDFGGGVGVEVALTDDVHGGLLAVTSSRRADAALQQPLHHFDLAKRRRFGASREMGDSHLTRHFVPKVNSLPMYKLVASWNSYQRRLSHSSSGWLIPFVKCSCTLAGCLWKISWGLMYLPESFGSGAHLAATFMTPSTSPSRSARKSTTRQ
eukprot:scaffold434_cov186-Pinguiococcus_pyrenoidosus.AAC.81